MRTDSRDIKISRKIKTALAFIVIFMSTIYCLHTLWKSRRGISPVGTLSSSVQPSPATQDTPSGSSQPGTTYMELESKFPMKPFPQENLNQVVRQLAEDLNLSVKQKIQLGKVWLGGPPQSPEELQQRLEQTREQLTLDQRDTLQNFLDMRVSQRVVERREIARRALPSDQFKIYEKGLGKVEDYFIELLKEQAQSETASGGKQK